MSQDSESLSLERTLEVPPTPELEDAYIRSLAWAPNGSLIAAATRHGVAVWDVDAGALVAWLEDAIRFAWAPDSKRLVLVPWGGAPTVVDLATGDRYDLLAASMTLSG